MARVSLAVDRPEPWLDGDRQVLAAFLHSSRTGTKLKNMLMYDLLSAALVPGKKSHHEQGVRDGKNATLGLLLALAQSGEPEAASDTAQTDDNPCQFS